MKAYPEYKEAGIKWINNVPKNWDVKPLFAIMSENRESNTGNIEQNVLSLSYGKIIRRDLSENFGLLPESFGTYQIVHPGYIVLRLTDLQNDKKSLRVGLVKEKGIITSAYVGLKSSRLLNSTFIYYLLHAYDLVKVFYGEGAGVRQSMTYKDLRRMPIIVPPLSEQKAIANFLEQKTAQIETLIEKKQRQIDLLQEQRTELINQAVTTGLNPDAPMKASGVEWLGKIPSHWEVKKLRRYNVFVQTGPFGSQLHASDYVPNGFPVVNPANMINGNIVPDEKKQISDEKRQELSNHILQAGDIVFARRGELGRAVLVTEREVGWLCGTGSILIRFFEARLRSDYLSHYLQLQTLKDYFISESVGSTMDNLNSQILLSMPLIEPPIEEQFGIVDYVNNVQEKTYQLIEKISSQIELLQEYRTALISEAVTGKIDVR